MVSRIHASSQVHDRGPVDGSLGDDCPGDDQPCMLGHSLADLQ